MPPPSLLLLHSRARLPPRRQAGSSAPRPPRGTSRRRRSSPPDGPLAAGRTRRHGGEGVQGRGHLRRSARQGRVARLGAGCLRRRRHCCGSFYYKHCCPDRGLTFCHRGNSAAVAITTTDLVSKSITVQTEIGVPIRIGGMAKGSGMVHPNMETMLGVLTTDAQVSSDVWREMVRTSVRRYFNQITVMQGLANSIAWDGEGATCLIEATVTGANNEAEAAKIARSVPSSSLVKGVAKEVERHGAVI